MTAQSTLAVHGRITPRRAAAAAVSLMRLLEILETREKGTREVESPESPLLDRSPVRGRPVQST
jgi:hypothetical protein